MKRLLNVLIIASCLILLGCEKDKEYVDSKEPGSITILEIVDNTIPVHTTETYQLQLAVLPEDAEITDPVQYAYRSNDKEIFTVSNTGLITGVGIGDAVLTITSTNYPELKTLAMVKVTDRVYDVTAIEIDPKFKDYSMSKGSIIDLSKYITVKPDNASNPKLAYSSSDAKIVSVTEAGVLEALELGEVTISIKATDGSNVLLECKVKVKEATYTPLDRNGWTVTLSHLIPKDASISNAAESLIDGDGKTCLSMVKPGKSYDGIKVPDGDEVFFVIDMKQETSFDYLNIMHRTSNANAYLRPYAYSIWGSNDGTTFVPVLTDVEGKPALPEFTIDIPVTVKYRYVKVVYTLWDTKSGSTMQLAELNIGNKVF